ncbi:MAG: tripartite tricarboxylate transporter substrate binding protein [Deltaproteobacteria bacterium]|nr:tripartite tricarboxylate transporter substrate binding protein [Deltaproteobacteria bacterium]
MRKGGQKKEAGWPKRGLFSLFLTFFLLIFITPPGGSAEKTYPDRPINLVVPYAPGGAADLGSKVVAERIAEFLGQPIISQYKPGGGGSLGAALVAKAKPDGYTLLVGSSTPLVLSPIVKKLDYKLDDFIPIGIYGITPIWLAVKADARWKTLKDFVDEAKKSPGKLTVGSYGKLTAAHFVIEMLSKQAGIQLTHVPYKATPEALTAVLGGHADGAFVTGAGGLLESGSVRILAAAAEQRLEGVPDVPTFKESGYPIVLSATYSLCFPKGTPKESVDKLHNAQKKAFERYAKEIREGMRKVEVWAQFLSPEETIKQWKKEYDLIYRIAEELGVLAK